MTYKKEILVNIIKTKGEMCGDCEYCPLNPVINCIQYEGIALSNEAIKMYEEMYGIDTIVEDLI